MKYEAALKLWGATKVAECYRMTVEDFVLDSVSVTFDFNEGYACCGGRDPDCYCSFAESPSADVVVDAERKAGGALRWSMDMASFDFATVLEELLIVGDGTITA